MADGWKETSSSSSFSVWLNVTTSSSSLKRGEREKLWRAFKSRIWKVSMKNITRDSGRRRDWRGSSSQPQTGEGSRRTLLYQFLHRSSSSLSPLSSLFLSVIGVTRCISESVSASVAIAGQIATTEEWGRRTEHLSRQQNRPHLDFIIVRLTSLNIKLKGHTRKDFGRNSYQNCFEIFLPSDSTNRTPRDFSFSVSFSDVFAI